MKNLKHFYHCFLYILRDTSGEGELSILYDITEVIISGVTYVVKSFYTGDATVDVTEKIQRLIDKDAKNS